MRPIGRPKLNRAVQALRAAALLLCALAAGGAPASAAPHDLPEYAVKAAFLYRFAQFVEWPDDVARQAGPLTIGVLGKDPFGGLLDRAVLGKTVRGRSLAVRRFGSAEEARDCDILFVSSSEAPRLKDILAPLAEASVLTVGEADRFAGRGGMIAFFFEDGRVQLEVNVAATQAARLRVSSQLLSVARLVNQVETGGR